MTITESFQNPESDYGQGPFTLIVKTDKGTASVHFGEGEPEDFSFSRDLNAVFNIGKMLQLAYEAGQRGEVFEYIFTDKEI